MGYEVPCEQTNQEHVNESSSDRGDSWPWHQHALIQSVDQTTSQCTNTTPCIHEGCGKQQDIMRHNKMSKHRPHDHETNPVKQQWDSLILMTISDPAPWRTHCGRDLNMSHVSYSCPTCPTLLLLSSCLCLPLGLTCTLILTLDPSSGAHCKGKSVDIPSHSSHFIRFPFVPV